MSAIRYFLKLDGVEGESTVTRHAGELEVDSFSWSESSSAGALATGGGLGAGKVVKQEFRWAMKASKASPKLMLACATGQHLKSATLSCDTTGVVARTPF